MELNKYQERIFEIGRKKNTKLVLPEKEDPRVSLAKRNLINLGYQLIETEEFIIMESRYREILEKERFFNKMSEEAK